MNITQFKQALPALLKNNVVPFVWGVQGVGKTQVVKQCADSLGLDFVHLHLATQEVGDLVGLLIQNGDGTVRHARPEWFPTEGKGIIFLDELNRAHPDVIQAMFSFITSKTIHRHKLPEGWKIVAAGNYGDDMTLTDTSDQAWLSRFCHIDFEPSYEEFCAFAEQRGDVVISDFIAEHSECLEAQKRKKNDINITPDRRAWLEMLAPLENEALDEEIRYELYKGIVGNVAATSYVTWKKSKERKIRLRDITSNYPAIRERVKQFNKEKETRFDALAAPLNELESKIGNPAFALNSSEVDNLKAYLLDVPLELLHSMSKKLSKLEFSFKNQLLNDPAFVSRLFK